MKDTGVEPKWLVEFKRARLRLQRLEPFYAYLLYYLEIVHGDLYGRFNGSGMPSLVEKKDGEEIRDGDFPITVAVDNAHLYVNPRMIQEEWYGFYERKNGQCSYVETFLAHESLHPALLDNERRGRRISSIWNMAMDAEINYQLEQDGFRFPAGIGQIPGDPRVAEAIYDELIQKMEDELSKQPGNSSGQKQDGESQEQGSSSQKQDGEGQQPSEEKGEGQSPGNSSPSPLEDYARSKAQQRMANDSMGGNESQDNRKGEAEELAGQSSVSKNNWKEIAAQAVVQAKMQGNMPGDMQEKLDRAAEPKVNWKEVIKRRVRTLLHRKFNFERPNRRQRQDGIVMMTPTKRDIKICFTLDTSGSMGTEELRQGLAEIFAAFNSFKNVEMLILMVDAAVAHVCHNPSEIEIKGRGGTDFRPAFRYIEALARRDKPQILVYITDGEGTFPKQAPDYPVIWAMTTDVQPPFGEIIRIYRE